MLAGIGLFAFGLRSLHIRALSSTPLFSILLGDSKRYVEWASEIAAGNWIGTGAFYQAPLYPYFLGALFTVFGQSIDIVRIAQAVAGAMACVLVASAARTLFEPRTGLIAGLLLAVYPAAIFFDGHIQKSSLDLLLMAMILVGLVQYQHDDRDRWLALVGMSLGCLMLNRENARLLYPVFVVWLLLWNRARPRRRRLRLVGVLTAVVLIPLAPVALRNYYVSGDLLLSTSQLGSNFYIGNHRGASGVYEPLIADRGSVEFEQRDAMSIASTAAGRALSPGEVSSFWLRSAVDEIRADVAGWLRLMATKTLLAVNTVESMDTESLEFHAQHSPVLRALMPLTFGVLLPVAVLGIVVTARDYRRLAVLYATALFFLGSVIVFFVLARYRHPVLAILVVFAAAALTHVTNLARVRSRATVTACVVALAIGIVVNRPMRVTTDETARNFGTELLRLDRPREALPLLLQAVESLPNDPDVRRDLALAYLKNGDARAAMAEYAVVARLQPGSPANFRELAAAAQAAGDREAARDAYHRGLAASGHDPNETVKMQVLIAGLDVAEGKLDDALAMLQRAGTLARSSGQTAVANDIELTIQAVRESTQRNK